MTKEKKILLYFISFLFGLLTIMLIGMSNVFALTNKTIYSGVNESGLTGSGYYNYGYINAGGVQNTTTAQVGSTINGISYGFQFYYYEDIILNNTYSLKINFKDNDLLKSVNSNNFDIKTCTNNNCSNAIIISLEKQNQNSNSSWVIVKFNPVDIGNIVSVDIGSENNDAITGINTFGISSIQTEYSNANQDIIDNNNNNTNNIIDNNNNNTQNIIDSVQGTIKDTFEDCRPSINFFNANSYTYTNENNSGQPTIINANELSVPFYGSWARLRATITGLKPDSIYTISAYLDKSSYDSNVLSGFYGSDNYQNNAFTYSSGEVYFTFTTDSNGNYNNLFYGNWSNDNSSGRIVYKNIQINEGTTKKPFEPYGQETCQNKIDETNDKLDNLNGTLNNSDINGATNDASNFFSNFTTDTFGLTSIITAPLSLINTLTSSSCSTLRLPLPYLDNKYLELPCMETIYSKYFGSFFNIYQTITFGIVSYWVIVRIFNQVKDFKNPDHDEIEVLDL